MNGRSVCSYLTGVFSAFYTAGTHHDLLIEVTRIRERTHVVGDESHLDLLQLRRILTALAHCMPVWSRIGKNLNLLSKSD